MEPEIAVAIDELFGPDAGARNTAFGQLIAATDTPVEWAYDVWDRAVAGLRDKDNHIRAVSAQLLCNLAKSDPDLRMARTFPELLAVTRDPRFVTARHCLQNIWKVAIAGPAQVVFVLEGLTTRYAESSTEKNGTLIRYDILVDLAQVYDRVPDESVKDLALGWITAEPDPRYRKKYAAVWRGR